MSISINKKFVIYIGLCLLFIMWLCCSNHFFGSLAPADIVPRKSSEFSEWKMTGYCNIDNIIYDDTSFIKEVSLSGWAFIPTEISDKNRKVELVLLSPEHTYSVEVVETQSRPDVVAACQNILKQGNKNDMGFQTGFSSIEIEDGIYTLYIACQENEQDYGLIFTGKQFVKNGRIFEEYIFRSVERESITAEKKLDYCSVDSVLAAQNLLTISGWGFINGQNCLEQEVFIQLTDGAQEVAYTTQSVQRRDVAQAYENDDYMLSGYRTAIPLDNLEPGNYGVEIIIKNKEDIRGGVRGTIAIKSDGSVTYKK